MKQSKIKALTNRNLRETLSRVNELKCPLLFAVLKEITKTDNGAP